MKKILLSLVFLCFAANLKADDASLYLNLLKNMQKAVAQNEFKTPMRGVKLGKYVLQENTCQRETESVKLVFAQAWQKELIDRTKWGLKEAQDAEKKER